MTRFVEHEVNGQAGELVVPISRNHRDMEA